MVPLLDLEHAFNEGDASLVQRRWANVDTQVRGKVIAHPVGRRLLEMVWAMITRLAKWAGPKLQLSHKRGDMTLRRKAGGHARSR